jgi:DNA-binding transcriptional LysR family regulator
MRSLNLDQLRTLATVAELGSFSAAAKRLNLSQPAVSLQVRELETRLGVGLVERLGKKAYPTAAGQELLAHAQRLMQAEESALFSMRRHREGLAGRVRIGTNAHYLIHCLPPVLRKLRAGFPMIELVIRTDITPGLLERMERNEIDVGLVTLPVEERGFAVTVVRQDPMFAALPAGYGDIPDKVSPAYAAHQPLIAEDRRSAVGGLVNGWFQAGGVTMRPVMELDNVEAMVSVVAAGLGMSIVDDLPTFRTRSALSGADIVLRPLDPPLTRSIGVVVRRDKPVDPALAIVCDALAAIAQQAPQSGDEIARRRETEPDRFAGERAPLDERLADPGKAERLARDGAARPARAGRPPQAPPHARRRHLA